ncbi:MAG: TlpA family protein disulfide reductase [Solirubrobacterales bacterium]|nr:TlpA family protein disulfide reductase [Solirubrobacterales bacterium]MBV9168266.1 TlpA family protein disulfide reductase [Solirubrobacterales bacterium]MBV9535539.1 TlpA family protein disulfide reductase [Solirubrobacterales bacterium]
MRRLLLPSSAIILAAALVGLLAFGISSQGANTSIDSALAHGVRPVAPDSRAALPVLGSSGRESLADFRGKVVIMNVFASWCTPCVAEAPILEQTERRIAADNATVVGVTYLDNSGDSAQFVRQHHISYPVLRDVSGNFVRAFGTTGVPETFVIDRSGRIAAVRRFQVTSQWLQSSLAPLLGHRA